ncbi:biogenesis of lysosome-related organelles complex-1 subunit 2-domain-containing protein [Glomus cerebriforme]|uniref:Biogenesis of lysosome-related organelles complex-1 subunit 2-domain-containing protein n=1 Tax=Glomus cerebriforme TaxID=658196 RepID=A0A397TPU2_9GLOM|nr:biogenesis of lysosome-related organelles complex-1 subunit 2-domain-containing protein [Glomus cerebriforme]
MSGQDKTTSPPTSSSSTLTSSTTNTLTSAINSTTSALTSTFSSLSSVLPLATSQQITQQQQQPQQSSSPTKARRTTTSTHTSVHSEIENQFSASDGNENKPSRNVNKLTEEMFSKVGEYLKGEILATTEDYKLLETMNKVTRDRYKEMSGMAQNLVVEMAKLQKIYSHFEPYVRQIDEICEQVDFLEKVAIELDEYSKELESRLKKLTK